MLNLIATVSQTIFSNSTNTVWLAAIVLLLIIEAATAGLTSIWFAIGALAALIASLLALQFGCRYYGFSLLPLLLYISPDL